MDDLRQLALEIFEISHLTGDFLLRSGSRSKEYFDKYRFEAEPGILREIAKGLAKLLPDSVDYLAGLELGGVPLATAVSLCTGKPVVFIRKQAKEYGTCQFAEGKSIKGKRLCLIEDVITTGGQVIQSANDLRGAGAIVEDVICVILRDPAATEKLKAQGLNCRHLLTMDFIKASQADRS